MDETLDVLHSAIVSPVLGSLDLVRISRYDSSPQCSPFYPIGEIAIDQASEA